MNKKDKLIVIGKGYPRKNLFDGVTGSSNINHIDTSNAVNLTSYAGQSASDLSSKKLPDLKSVGQTLGTAIGGSGGAGYGAIGAAANTAADTMDKLFLNKGAHNEVGDVLNTVSDIMPAWNPYSLIAKGVLKVGAIVANGLTNTVNKQQVKQKGAEISNIAGLKSNAADYENLQQAYDAYRRVNVDLGKVKDWGSAGFLSSGSKRRKAYRTAENALEAAMEMRDNNLYQTGMNINKNNIFNQLGTLRAFGGPLGMWDTSGAVNYGFMSDWLAAKNKQADNKNNLGGGTIGTVSSSMNSFAGGGGKFGGGSFEGSGSGGSWDDEPANTYNVSNFNEAFDRAVKEGRKEFIFQGRVYNTKKENNPVREFNNRWVGQGRKANKKNPSKSYDHQAGPIGGALAAIPIVTDTYIGSPERPPQLEYRDTPVENMDGVLLDRGFINNTFFPSYLPMSKPIKRALGGVLQTHGGDWSDGLTIIGAGGTHEENPNEGVQSGVDPEGVPNLVEEGEAIWNDYVFSNRIEVPEEVKKHLKVHGKELTFADAAKKLEKEISERPNDPISKAGFNASMEYLENAQEEVKAKMEAEKAQEAFNALPPEEQVAIMQQAAQQEQMSQEQAIQEQAMAEQAAVQQQPTPEEMAMMQQQVPQEQMMSQQMIPQGIPEAAMAYGGLANRFDLGGLAWVKKHHPEVKNPQAVAKALEKMMQENKSNYYRPEGVSFFSNNKNRKYSWDFDMAWNQMAPSVTYLSARERSFNKWVKYGLSREDAFNISHPDSYYKGYRGDLAVERKRDYDNAYKRLVKDYKQPAATSKTQNVKQEKKKVYTTSTGKADYEKAYWRTVNSEKATQAAMQKNAKQQQDSIEKTSTKRAEKNPADTKQPVKQATEQNIKEQTKSIENSTKDIASRNAAPAPAKTEQNNTPKQSKFEAYREYRRNNPFEDTASQNDLIADAQALADANGMSLEVEGAAPGTNTKPNNKEWNIGNYEWLSGEFSPSNTTGFIPYNRNMDADAVKAKEDSDEYKAWTDYVLSNWNADPVKKYRELLAEKAGNKIILDDSDEARDYFQYARGVGEGSDHAWGYYHLNPTWADEVANAALNTTVDSNSPAQATSQNNNGTAVTTNGTTVTANGTTGADNNSTNNNSQSGNTGPYTVNPDDDHLTPEERARAKAEAEQAAMDAAGVSIAPIHRNENLRYAGLMGPALGLGMQMAGIGRPDTSGIMAAASRAGQPPVLATYKPIGEYLKYNPYDVNYAANQLANTSAGNRRAILNSNASAGARNAMLLAQNFNDQNALGNLYRQAQEYNNQHRAQVSDFNRGTDQFNAQASTQTSQFNADAINRNRQYASQMAMQAAREKMDADAGWYQSIYGNVGALAKGISDLGRENAQRNMVADMAANGIFGKATPNTHGFNTIIQYVDKDGNPMIKDANGNWVKAIAAKGGKLNKKRRGGLTY